MDNDDLPFISITDATAVVEGTDANAVFTLTAFRPASETRTVNVSVTGATRFIATGQIPTTVTFEKDSSTAVLNIPIEDDEIYDHYGYIDVRLLRDTSTPKPIQFIQMMPKFGLKTMNETSVYSNSC